MSGYLCEAKFAYSTYAEKLLEDIVSKLPSKCEIKWVYENVSCDGYDRYGPEAYLYDLFVIVFNKESNLFTYSYYHTENWYDGSVVSYVLEEEYVSKIYSPVKSYHDFNKV
jgi:hypothetical protein